MGFICDSGGRGDVAQGEAYAPLVGYVGVGTVDDVGVVDGDVACVEFEVYSVGVVDLVGMNAQEEYVLFGVEVDEFSAFKQVLVLGAGQDAHTPVFDGRVIERHPAALAAT